MSRFDEVKMVPAKVVKKYSTNEATGHYTQMVWGQTRFVGCGHTTYKGGMGVKKLIVCNYGPAGNVLDKQMYQQGKQVLNTLLVHINFSRPIHHHICSCTSVPSATREPLAPPGKWPAFAV